MKSNLTNIIYQFYGQNNYEIQPIPVTLQAMA
jgi:hypothetical protein